MLLQLQLQGATGLLLPVNKLLGRSGKRDDLPPGGRLSRRAADPVAEAERKAQQEKLYFLDIERILGGVLAYLWAVFSMLFYIGGGACNALPRVRGDSGEQRSSRCVHPVRSRVPRVVR